MKHCGYYITIPQFTSIGETETQADIFYNLPTVRDRNIHGVSHVDITIQESRIFMRPMGTQEIRIMVTKQNVSFTYSTVHQ